MWRGLPWPAHEAAQGRGPGRVDRVGGADLHGAGGREIRLRAERRAKEMLREMEKATGAKGIGKKVVSSNGDSTPRPASVPTLKSLGITRDQSADWQKLAKIAEPVAEAGGGG